MSTILQSVAASPKIIIPAIAAVITFGLFVIMQALISQDSVTMTSVAPIVPLDIVYHSEDPDIIKKTKLKPPPKLKPIPNTEPLKVGESAQPGLVGEFRPQIPIDQVQIDDQLRLGGTAQASPVVRITPKYPVGASRDGIQGWVRLAFDVSPLGTTENISIIDAEPKRIFNREAKRALAKWKYRPKKVDGKAVAQSGFEVVLDFKLEQ